MRGTLFERLFAKVNKHGRLMPGMRTRCHEWTGAKDSSGYGSIGFSGKVVSTHRAAFFLKHGRWPEPQALHRCDNRACVRVSHIFEGTNQDNVTDKVLKGRAKTVSWFGEKNANAKLSDDEVEAIRQEYAARRTPQHILAKRFKTSQRHVSRLIRGERRPKRGLEKAIDRIAPLATTAAPVG